MSRSIRSLAAGIFCILALTTSVRADSYPVDPVHSSILFRIQHANAGYTFGWFKGFAGTVVTDSDPSKMSVEVSVKVDSIDTGNGKRDQHLKSNDFFSAAEFPTISFKSTKVTSSGDNKFEVAGDLALHGQTKPITIMLEKTGASNSPQMGDRVGFFTTFMVKRADYGMAAMPGMVGDEVQLQVALEGVKAK